MLRHGRQWWRAAPSGRRRIYMGAMEATYDSAAVEMPRLLEVASPHERADRSSTPFVMCMPPTSVAGSPTVGHALTIAIEDSVVRWRRMHGQKVVWIPGQDHGGVATQAAVERWLRKDKQKTRQDLSRAELIKACHGWRLEKSKEMSRMCARLGASLNWGFKYYTASASFQAAVNSAFKRLFDDGLIFRDRRLVSWCPTLCSAVAPPDVETVDFAGGAQYRVPGVDGRSVDVGRLYLVNYPLVDDVLGAAITVSMTRPETTLADVAVAVHPRDSRWSRLIGKRATHPLLPERQLTIIGDDTVDPDCGSGAVPVAPAHSTADWALALKHGLPTNVACLNDAAQITDEFVSYAGLDRFAARKMIVTDLVNAGHFSEQRDQAVSLAVCNQSGDLVDYMVKELWFLDCRSMAEEALTAFEDGRLTFKPEAYGETWRELLRQSANGDWCLSRQLCWGHRVPAYRSGTRWLAANSMNEATNEFRERHPDEWRRAKLAVDQDADVLDSWFSAALVPLIVSGWPSGGDPAARSHFPLSMLDCEHDALGHWVARMVMLSVRYGPSAAFGGEALRCRLRGELPFDRVFLHGAVRDSSKRQLSKTIGRTIAPTDVIDGCKLDVLEGRVRAAADLGELSATEAEQALKELRRDLPTGIERSGADALRFALLLDDAAEPERAVNYAHVHRARAFANQLWNARKFCAGVWDKCDSGAEHVVDADRVLIDRWVMSRLCAAAVTVNDAMQQFDFHRATAAVHAFFVDEFINIYLECSKTALEASDVERLNVIGTELKKCMEVGCRLLAPFMPFLATEIYSRLPQGSTATGESREPVPVSLTAFPTNNELGGRDADLDAHMHATILILNEIIQLRDLFGVRKMIPFQLILCAKREMRQSARQFDDVLQRLGNAHIVNCIEPVVVDEMQLDGSLLPVDCRDFQLLINLQVAGASAAAPQVFDVSRAAHRVQLRVAELKKERAAVQLDVDALSERIGRVGARAGKSKQLRARKAVVARRLAKLDAERERAKRIHAIMLSALQGGGAADDTAPPQEGSSVSQ